MEKIRTYAQYAQKKIGNYVHWKKMTKKYNIIIDKKIFEQQINVAH